MPEDQEPTGPSLEPPSFRKRRKLISGSFTPPSPVAPDTTAADPVVDEEVPADDTPTTIFDDVPAEPAARAPKAPKPARAPKAPKAPKVKKPPREKPLVPGMVAAAITGLLVGGVIVGLTDASFSLCEKVQGTSSCGGPGFFLLVAILVASVVLGSLLLRIFRVGEPGSTSFLAVGLTSVIALLFLVDSLFEWYMLIVIPLVSVATYLLSHWVTATFVETEPA